VAGLRAPEAGRPRGRPGTRAAGCARRTEERRERPGVSDRENAVRLPPDDRHGQVQGRDRVIYVPLPLDGFRLEAGERGSGGPAHEVVEHETRGRRSPRRHGRLHRAARGLAVLRQQLDPFGELCFGGRAVHQDDVRDRSGAALGHDEGEPTAQRVADQCSGRALLGDHGLDARDQIADRERSGVWRAVAVSGQVERHHAMPREQRRCYASPGARVVVRAMDEDHHRTRASRPRFDRPCRTAHGAAREAGARERTPPHPLE
jgi:hypothetical protein